MKLKYLFIFLLVFIPFSSEAYTSYEPQVTDEVITYLVDFPTSGSGVNQTPIYQWDIALPEGTVFDRIQIGVADSVTSYGTMSFRPIEFTGDSSWNCLNSNCGNNRNDWGLLSIGSFTNPTPGTLQTILSSSYTASSSVDAIRITMNVGSNQDITLKGGNLNVNTAGLNGAVYTKIANGFAPQIKFCNGACDGNSFNDGLVPPEVPQNGYQTRFTDASVSSTTIVSTYFVELAEWSAVYKPDYVTVTTALNGSSTHQYSTNQLILPLVQGLSSSTIPLGNNAFPVDGEYNVYFTMTSIAGSYVAISGIGWNVIVTITSGEVTNVEDMPVYDPDELVTWQPCGLTEITGCFVNVGILLFVPDTEKVTQFTNLSDTLESKFPFVYVYQFSDAISDLYTGTPTASSTISYDFAGLGTMTLLSVDLLEDVPYQAWLRNVIGYLMWIMFAILMYNRGLRIFNTNPQ